MGALERLEGWEGRLSAVIEGTLGVPYRLGTSDCFSFACAAVLALTGRDLYAEWAGTYSTRREALVALAKFGGDFTGSGTKFFGVEPVSWKRAQRGDILEYTGADGDKHLGVCNGAVGVVYSDAGLASIALDEFNHAWKIG